MRVLAYSQIFPSALEPVIGPFNLRTFAALAELAQVDVVSPRAAWRRLKSPGQFVNTPHEQHGKLSVWYPAWFSIPGAIGLHGAAQLAGSRRAVARLWPDFPFDAVIAAWAYPDGVAAASLAAEHGVPAIVLCLGSDVNILLNKPNIAAAMRRGLKSVYRIITVSHALRDRMLDAGFPPDQVTVQHNAVDGDSFTVGNMRAARELLRLPPDERIVCSVGRLSYEKGFDILLAAFARLIGICKTGTRLVIVGDGRERSALIKQAAALGLEGHVQFAGAKLPSEVPLWMCAADVVCLPSRREGCPNVVLEALACGRPVVGARVGGVQELLNAANGVLIEPENPRALTDGLAEALDRRWDPAALRASVAFLSWDCVGLRYYNLLRQAIAEAVVARQPVG